MVLRADIGHRATMGDLLGVLADVEAHPPFTGADLAARLSPAASGSLAQLFAANPDLDDPPPLVVFDLRSVPARARPAVMACVLAWTWDRATTGAVATPRLLVVDEAHLLLDDPAAADLLAQFARRARKYHLGVDVVTQRLADFLGNPAGQAVLANTATKLLLGCEDHDRAAVASGLGLTDAEAALLRAGRRGHGLLLTPTLRAAVRIVAHPAEHELASTGPRSR
jgi:type IV secretory pathway VirB4 component